MNAKASASLLMSLRLGDGEDRPPVPSGANNQVLSEQPLPCFPMKFKWNSAWAPIFDLQTLLVRDDIDRALAEDKVIVYLSCPISGRGGGHPGTNVEIARFVESRLLSRFGERFWVINPTRYQMESGEGTGLIHAHARRLGWSSAEVEQALRDVPLTGGDYMRMWLQVLVENRLDREPNAPIPCIGNRIDAYYFLGPNEVHEFFMQGSGLNLTAAVEGYFARKMATDATFSEAFGQHPIASPAWEARRKEFFRFYAVKASIGFSLGSRDEWNIFKLLNDERDAYFSGERVGARLAGFFDGRQIDPASAESMIAGGYVI